MPAPFSAFPDPEMDRLQERLAGHREAYAARALLEKPVSLVEGLPVRLLAQALKAIGADEGSVWLAQDEGRKLVPVWNNGPDAASFVGCFELPSHQGLTGMAYTSGQAACESEVCFHQQQNRELDRSLKVLTWTLMAIPLRFAGGTQGIVTAVRLIRLGDLPGLAQIPASSADFLAGYAPPPSFSMEELAALETATAALGRLVDHRLTGWVFGTEG